MTHSIRDVNAARDRIIHDLIENFGACREDLKDAGLSDYAARRWLAKASRRPLAPHEAVPIPVPAQLPGPGQGADVVALVPVNDIARRYLAHDIYLRDATLYSQIRLNSVYFGYSDNGAIQVVRPITRRWRIGSALAIAATGVEHAQAILAEHDVHAGWPGLATLVELGEPITVGLSLGRPGPTKRGALALQGLSYELLSDMRAAAAAGGDLRHMGT